MGVTATKGDGPWSREGEVGFRGPIGILLPRTAPETGVRWGGKKGVGEKETLEKVEKKKKKEKKNPCNGEGEDKNKNGSNQLQWLKGARPQLKQRVRRSHGSLRELFGGRPTGPEGTMGMTGQWGAVQTWARSLHTVSRWNASRAKKGQIKGSVQKRK